MSADGVFRTRSLGAAASGLSDQYSDGKAAKVWERYIGDTSKRTDTYKNFLVDMLNERKCKHILDVACGTGIDSVMLIDSGFDVVSSDASDKMLQSAYKTRWDRRKEPAFDKWVIEEGNWLSLDRDVLPTTPPAGFDAIICMGNSFAHMPDPKQHKQAIENFFMLLRPGGTLFIDHRNYDSILDKGHSPKNNIYYDSKHITDIKTSVLHVNGKATLITLDYEMDVTGLNSKRFDENIGQFRLSYYPHRLVDFKALLNGVFGSSAKHLVCGDFKRLEVIPNPAFYIHVIEKPLI
jgi:glycine N-methyltransferase